MKPCAALFRFLGCLAMAGAACLAGGVAVAGTPAGKALRPFTAATPEVLRVSHAGEPWVLVLWSVSCEPCRAELAHWAQRRRDNPRIAIEIVSVDDAAESELAERLLAQAGIADPARQRPAGKAGAAQWIFADDYVERLRHAIDPGWHGEVPRTYFFDRQSGRTASSGALAPRDVAEWFRRQGGKT
jgi:hypothetical protein